MHLCALHAIGRPLTPWHTLAHLCQLVEPLPSWLLPPTQRRPTPTTRPPSARPPCPACSSRLLARRACAGGWSAFPRSTHLQDRGWADFAALAVVDPDCHPAAGVLAGGLAGEHCEVVRVSRTVSCVASATSSRVTHQHRVSLVHCPYYTRRGAPHNKYLPVVCRFLQNANASHSQDSRFRAQLVEPLAAHRTARASTLRGRLLENSTEWAPSSVSWLARLLQRPVMPSARLPLERRRLHSPRRIDRRPTVERVLAIVTDQLHPGRVPLRVPRLDSLAAVVAPCAELGEAGEGGVEVTRPRCQRARLASAPSAHPVV
jgi:hypothetical protein